MSASAASCSSGCDAEAASSGAAKRSSIIALKSALERSCTRFTQRARLRFAYRTSRESRFFSAPVSRCLAVKSSRADWLSKGMFFMGSRPFRNVPSTLSVETLFAESVELPVEPLGAMAPAEGRNCDRGRGRVQRREERNWNPQRLGPNIHHSCNYLWGTRATPARRNCFLAKTYVRYRVIGSLKFLRECWNCEVTCSYPTADSGSYRTPPAMSFLRRDHGRKHFVACAFMTATRGPLKK